MTIHELQDAYVQDLAGLKDWFSQYEFLIELAGAMEVMDDEDKNEDTRLKGCQTNAWLIHEYDDGKLYFQADSDALIVKGILGMLTDIFSDRTPEEILNAELFVLQKSGIGANLTQGRANGIQSAIDRIHQIAREAR